MIGIEYKVDEKFRAVVNGKTVTLKVVSSPTGSTSRVCDHCFVFDNKTEQCRRPLMKCMGRERSDGRQVIFKEVK